MGAMDGGNHDDTARGKREREKERKGGGGGEREREERYVCVLGERYVTLLH